MLQDDVSFGLGVKKGVEGVKVRDDRRILLKENEGHVVGGIGYIKGYRVYSVSTKKGYGNV